MDMEGEEVLWWYVCTVEKCYRALSHDIDMKIHKRQEHNSTSASNILILSVTPDLTPKVAIPRLAPLVPLLCAADLQIPISAVAVNGRIRRRRTTGRTTDRGQSSRLSPSPDTTLEIKIEAPSTSHPVPTSSGHGHEQFSFHHPLNIKEEVSFNSYDDSSGVTDSFVDSLQNGDDKPIEITQVTSIRKGAGIAKISERVVGHVRQRPSVRDAREAEPLVMQDIALKIVCDKSHVIAAGGSLYECRHCDKTYPTKHGLNKHKYEVHGQIETRKCPTCQKIFTSRNGLKIHQTIVHSKTRDHLCNKCGFAFKSILELKKHSMLHLYDQANRNRKFKFVCEVCSKAVSTISALISHRSKHLTERPLQLQCQECGTMFRSKPCLVTHQRMAHSGHCPFICQEERTGRESNNESSGSQRKECGAKFKTIRALQRHRSAEHMYETEHDTPFACEDCPKKFKINRHLTKHVYRVHGNKRTKNVGSKAIKTPEATTNGLPVKLSCESNADPVLTIDSSIVENKV